MERLAPTFTACPVPIFCPAGWGRVKSKTHMYTHLHTHTHTHTHTHAHTHAHTYTHTHIHTHAHTHTHTQYILYCMYISMHVRAHHTLKLTACTKHAACTYVHKSAHTSYIYVFLASHHICRIIKELFRHARRSSGTSVSTCMQSH